MTPRFARGIPPRPLGVVPPRPLEVVPPQPFGVYPHMTALRQAYSAFSEFVGMPPVFFLRVKVK